MKSKLIIALCAFLTAKSVSAQTSDNNAYAITSEVKGSFQWTEVKLINLDNGEVVSNVFENKNEYAVYDGRTSKPITLPNQADSFTTQDQRPFAGLSAACAFDKKRNRLYFAPMFINQLRYIDLNTKTPHVYIFEDKTFSNAEDLKLEENHITRMVIAADGNGYALNNDGSHLVKFTTGEIPDVTDLGSLTDAVTNGEVSIKNPNTSWGGDMVADASGNLFLITDHNYVFKIDVTTRIATFIAEIKGLPGGFTTNGAVVGKAGKILLSSANFLNSYFVADPSSWTSEALPASDHVYNTSDLANNNFLYETKLPEVIETPTGAEKISLFPNPVKSNIFRISFENKQGNYNVQLVDVAGRLISDKSFSVSSSGQTTEVKVNASLARGVYMVKLLNHENKEVFLKKIILQ
jgi:hypothetical protein